MQREKVIELAKQAGMAGMATTVVCEISELEAFAALIEAETIERCAVVCDVAQRITAVSGAFIAADSIAKDIRGLK